MDAGKRPRIGLLIGWIDNDYYGAVWSGAMDATADAGADLYAFAGGDLASPEGYLAGRNAVYDLAGPETLDGVVLAADTVGRYVGHDELERRFGCLGVPAVSLEAHLRGMPSVRVDNRGGVRDLVAHLVEFHGRRRIAFVRGPEHNADAEDRFEAYRAALAAHGLAFDERLVAPGFFSRQSGMAAVRTFLDERGVRPDAVVAANDQTALGAMDALESRDVRVPEDVAVAGFDDLAEGLLASPPLTTVRQPLYELGRRGVEAVLARMGGREVPDETDLPTDLALRRSCGCLSGAAASGRTFAELLAERRAHVLAEMSLPGRRSVDRAAAERLVDAFAAEASASGSGVFARALEEIVSGLLSRTGDAAAWRDAVDVLRRETLAIPGSDEILLATEIWDRARAAAATLQQRAKAAEGVDAWRRSELPEVGWTLATTFDLRDLLEAAGRRIQDLGLARFRVALHGGGPLAPLSPGRRPDAGTADPARLVLACDGPGRVEVAPEGRPLPPRELLPSRAPDAGRPAAFVVMPLYVRKRRLGWAVFELGPTDGSVYESIARHLSAGLEGVLLLRDARAREAALRAEVETLRRDAPASRRDGARPPG